LILNSLFIILNGYWHITRNPYSSDRDALFDGYRTNTSSAQSNDPYLIEKQNDEQVASLSEKMKTLKEVIYL